jgi:hypothetical protein
VLRAVAVLESREPSHHLLRQVVRTPHSPQCRRRPDALGVDVKALAASGKIGAAGLMLAAEYTQNTSHSGNEVTVVK